MWRSPLPAPPQTPPTHTPPLWRVEVVDLVALVQATVPLQAAARHRGAHLLRQHAHQRLQLGQQAQQRGGP